MLRLGPFFARHLDAGVRRADGADGSIHDSVPNSVRSSVNAWRRVSAAALVMMLAAPVGPAYGESDPSLAGGAVAAKEALPRGPVKARLEDRDRALHLLNRFTFGATPESLAQVEAVGVKRWFEAQLSPAKLPVTAEDRYLSARLSQFPALQLPVEELLVDFPNGAEIRQTADGKRPMPADPTLAAVYRRHIDLYRDKQAEKAAGEKAVADAGDPNGMAKARTVSETQAARPGMTANGGGTPGATQAEDAAGAKRNELTASLLAMAPEARVKKIFSLPAEQYKTEFAGLKQPQRMALMADLSAHQREMLEDYENPTRTVVQEVQSERLLRDIYSSHQLQEVMTTFWLNHFNVYIHKNEQTPYFYASYERDVIAPRALGNFEDLLTATAKSPAMLMYLDNNTSTGPDSPAAVRQGTRIENGKAKKVAAPGLNENYARELMELHTLGVNGGYTQKDVTEVARVFTGWTVGKRDSRSMQAGEFKFDEGRHEPGTKMVLGHRIDAGGEKEGLEVLHMLATSPATAHFISTELARQFVSDEPPAALVNQMAKTFVSTHGEIAAVLRTMVNSKQFWASDTYQAKVKTPLEYVVSAARASHAEITNVQPLIGQLNQMGMPLFACVPPTGYSSMADAWVSTGALVTRMNFSLSLATNHLAGVVTNWPAQTGSTTGSSSGGISSASTAAEERALEADLIPGGIGEPTRSAILAEAATAADGKTDAAAWQNVQLAGLLLGSPEFQRR